ncbi:Calcium-transporting ATPase PAT1 [Smittium culicis]|uniref:Calcium-transporting ATPase n=1 Tax=Smittium culicis TaxID=133412 RepID=A0A1R1YF76_9FUNG|nr:Calcium-transporting ATPase PAT1 [Smittium culicis]
MANTSNNEGLPLLHENSALVNRNSNSSSNFEIPPNVLSSLFDPKDEQSLKKLGGLECLFKKLHVDPALGLSSNENFGSYSSLQTPSIPFEERRKVYGTNSLPEAKSASFLELLLNALNDSTLILLSLAAVVSLFVGLYDDYYGSHKNDPVKIGWVEGAAIMFAVAVVSLTNSINDYNKELQFRKLNAKKEDRKVKVIRDGQEVEIQIEDINVGEIMLIEPGDIMCVDSIFIEGHNVVCDESSATGESDAIKKGCLGSNRDCFILSGGKVMEGVGRVLVTAVGEHSFFGKIMLAMRGESTNNNTPLQIKLDKLSNEIAKFGVAAAAILFMCLSIKYLFSIVLGTEVVPFADILSKFISISIECITVIVVAVPEGLPMAVTISLAYATTQMIKDGNLVRQLAACETMGGATAVCTDKTGTLTQNKMTVVNAIIDKTELESQNDILPFINSLDKKVVTLLSEGISANSAAFMSADDNGKMEFVGSKSECALLEFIQSYGADYRNLRAENKPLFVWPFSSEKKSMSTALTTFVDNKKMCRVHVKGASEIVLSSCTHYLNAKGETLEITDSIRVEITRNIYRYAHKALRTFALAYKDIDISSADSFDPESAPLSDLTWIMLSGIMDPLRPGVNKSVGECHKAGVFVRMITGDNIETAEAIAKNAGILTKGGRSISGPDWRKLSPEQQHELLPRLQVMARSSPLDKQIVVRRLQERGEVVAMTGDGTNDAPALKMAEVGFSMGIAGTEVAKEASDIILMDDNFSSIVKAMLWGRAVNDSVRKFLQFQLTVNITAVVLTFVSSVISSTGDSALTAVQLLWVNIIMDTLAALALATEGPTNALLDRKPIPKNASLLTYEMWRMILLEAAFQVAVNLVLLNMGHELFRLPHNEQGNLTLGTIIFNTFVFLQIFNELNCRRIMPHEFNIFADLHNDTGFILVQIVIVATQYLIVTYGGIAFSTTPLSSEQWLACVLIGSLSVPVGFIIRLIPDFGLCFGLESSNSSAQQFVHPLSMDEMSRIQRQKDVKNVINFFGKIRSSMKDRENAKSVDRVIDISSPDLLTQSNTELVGSSSLSYSGQPLKLSKNSSLPHVKMHSGGWGRVATEIKNKNLSRESN